MLVEQARPRRRPRRRPGLRDVADDGHRPGGYAPDEQPPLHRRQLLRLVDDGVPEGPRAVLAGPVGERPERRAAGEPVGEHLGCHHLGGLAGLPQHPPGELEGLGALGGGDKGGLAGGVGRGDVRADELGRLVEERDVVRRPRRERVAEQERLLPLGEDPRRRRREPVGPGEQFGDQRRSPTAAATAGSPRAGRPGGSAAPPGSGRARRPRRSRLWRRRAARPGRRGRAGRRSPGPRCAACSTAAPGRARRRRPAAAARSTSPSIVSGSGRISRRCRRRTATVTTSAIRRSPLTTATSGRSRPVASTPGDELTRRGEDDAGLAEARQHLLDVAQEHRARADDEDAAAGDPLPVRVEQVGRPVQRDSGLAGARAALDDEDAAERRPDDPVLLGLQGRDDVAHPPGPVRGERRHERALTGDLREVGAGRDGVGERRRRRAPRRRGR